jgi:hypothetical protein
MANKRKKKQDCDFIKRFLNSDITTDVYPDAWTTAGEY